MEQLSIKEKAKAYDEAIERAKKCLKDGTITNTAKSYIEEIFPELAESEDDRIRKTIIELVEDYKESSPCGGFGGLKWDKLLDWLEKQGEQKSSDKVEPKFKVGDWIILTAGELSTTLQIVNVDTNKKLYWFNDSSYLPIVDEECLHLWTIQDAKDGDVLSYVTDEEDLCIMIYWSLYEPYEGHVHYHALLVNDNFCDKGTCCICIDDLKPATKEQRDTLFTKMKEAGYEWDAENKKLLL